MTVGRINGNDINLGFDECRDTVEDIRRHTDRRAYAQSPVIILARVRKLPPLLDILEGNQATEQAVVVDNRELFNLMLLQNLLGPIEVRPDGCGDEAILRHHRVQLDPTIRLEAEVTVRDDAGQAPVAVDDGDTSDRIARHQTAGVGNGIGRRERNRIKNHPALRTFDTAHLGGLLLDGHVLVQDADPTLARHRDGHLRLGDGIHRCRHNGDVQLDGLREPSADVHRTRHDFGPAGNQEDVVVGETLQDDFRLR